MIHPFIQVSQNEYQAAKEALKLGIRADGRSFLESRQLKINLSDKQGYAGVIIGNTRVTAHTSAVMTVPSPNSLSRGSHTININTTTQNTKRDNIDQFQTYFRMIWKSIHVVEEDTLCIKPGEKVWNLNTKVVITDDDGGLLEACFAAVIISLSTLRFPSFDSVTGTLYPPSQRHTHKLAFSLKPILVTIGFFNKRLISDLTLIEQQIVDGNAVFVFDDMYNQVFMEAVMPGDIDGARLEAIKVAKEWKSIYDQSFTAYDKSLNCVGSPPDFSNYQSPVNEIHQNAKPKQYDNFEIWKKDIHPVYILDSFDLESESVNHDAISHEINDDDWLMSSLTA